MRDAFKRRYTQQKANAAQRGVPFLLSFDEWKMIWIESGKWDQRGKGRGKYCMMRHGDAGPYAVGNVTIGLNEVNLSEGNLGRKLSDETKAKVSAFHKGRHHEYAIGENNVMHRTEVKAKISAATKGKKHYRFKGVITPGGIFESTTEAATALGIPAVTVQWRCRHNKFGFSYGVAIS